MSSPIQQSPTHNSSSLRLPEICKLLSAEAGCSFPRRSPSSLEELELTVSDFASKLTAQGLEAGGAQSIEPVKELTPLLQRLNTETGKIAASMRSSSSPQQSSEQLRQIDDHYQAIGQALDLKEQAIKEELMRNFGQDTKDLEQALATVQQGKVLVLQSRAEQVGQIAKLDSLLRKAADGLKETGNEELCLQLNEQIAVLDKWVEKSRNELEPLLVSELQSSILEVSSLWNDAVEGIQKAKSARQTSVLGEQTGRATRGRIVDSVNDLAGFVTDIAEDVHLRSQKDKNVCTPTLLGSLELKTLCDTLNDKLAERDNAISARIAAQQEKLRTLSPEDSQTYREQIAKDKAQRDTYLKPLNESIATVQKILCSLANYSGDVGTVTVRTVSVNVDTLGKYLNSEQRKQLGEAKQIVEDAMQGGAVLTDASSAVFKEKLDEFRVKNPQALLDVQLAQKAFQTSLNELGQMMEKDYQGCDPASAGKELLEDIDKSFAKVQESRARLLESMGVLLGVEGDPKSKAFQDKIREQVQASLKLSVASEEKKAELAKALKCVDITKLSESAARFSNLLNKNCDALELFIPRIEKKEDREKAQHDVDELREENRHRFESCLLADEGVRKAEERLNAVLSDPKATNNDRINATKRVREAHKQAKEAHEGLEKCAVHFCKTTESIAGHCSHRDRQEISKLAGNVEAGSQEYRRQIDRFGEQIDSFSMCARSFESQMTISEQYWQDVVAYQWTPMLSLNLFGKTRYSLNPLMFSNELRELENEKSKNVFALADKQLWKAIPPIDDRRSLADEVFHPEQSKVKADEQKGRELKQLLEMLGIEVPSDLSGALSVGELDLRLKLNESAYLYSREEQKKLKESGYRI